jgi:undecaprenyl-diphosphatase
MSIFEVILLGVVQGLTEFLPISSTAHLVVIPKLFGWPDPGLAYDIALHVGTLAAVLIYFFRDWVHILANGFGLGSASGGDPELRRNRMLLWLLILGTIPAGIAGLALQKQADTTLRTLPVIGVSAIVIGLFMWWADRAGRGQKTLGHVSRADSLAVGFAQVLAIIPGVSRSGITISAGLLRNFDRPTAARFSFLLSTPIIFGAAAKDAWDLLKHKDAIPPEMQTAFLLGIAVSGVTGCLTIALFMKYLRTRSLAFFVGYRIIFGIAVIAVPLFIHR